MGKQSKFISPTVEATGRWLNAGPSARAHFVMGSDARSICAPGLRTRSWRAAATDADAKHCPKCRNCLIEASAHLQCDVQQAGHWRCDCQHCRRFRDAYVSQKETPA